MCHMCPKDETMVLEAAELLASGACVDEVSAYNAVAMKYGHPTIRPVDETPGKEVFHLSEFQQTALGFVRTWQ